MIATVAAKAALLLAAAAALLAVDPMTVQAQGLVWIGVGTALVLAGVSAFTKIMEAIAAARSDLTNQTAQTAIDAKIDARVSAAILEHERIKHGPADGSTTGSAGVSGAGGMESTVGGGPA